MQTINLQTSQNVTIEYELATLGERIMAMIIDVITVVAGYYIFAAMILVFVKTTMEDFGFSFLSMAFIMLLFILYHFLFEFLGHGQSLGKRVLHIQVVRLDGEDVSGGDYMLRSVFYFIDLFSSGGVLGGLLIGSTANRQRFGDLAAGTGVIKMNPVDRFSLPDILRISSLEDYEPKYLEVRQFTEGDMLLIKSTLSRYQRYPNEAHRKLVFNLAQDLADKVGESDQVLHPKEFLTTLIRDYIVLTR